MLMAMCVECGEDRVSRVPEAHAEGHCFSCHFWLGHVNRKEDPRVVIVNKIHYRMGSRESNVPSGVRGFGGQLHVIRFLDGRVTRSADLWCQGGIPKRFQDRLPDNATFVGGSE